MADVTNPGTVATEDVAEQQAYLHGLGMQALAKQYGPGVYAGAEARQAQENYLNSQIDPLKIQEAQRQNTAGTAAVSQYGAQAGNPDAWKSDVSTAQDINEQQRMGAYRATKALQAQALPDGSLPPGAVDSVLTPANAQLFGLDSQHLAPLAALLKAPGGAQHLDTIEQSLIGPTKVTGAPIVAQGPNGQSELINRDQYGNPLTTSLAPGVTPVAQQRASTGEQNANTNVAKAGIAQQQANTAAYSANVRGANQTYAPQAGPQQAGAPAGMPSPQAIDKLIATKGIDRAIAEAPSDAMAQAIADRASANAKAQSVNLPPQIANLPPKGRQMAISQAQQIANQGTTIQNSHAILSQVMQQISPYTAGSGSLLKDIPGTAQTDLKANLETLNSMGLTTWIQSLKNAQGQTGVGRVLQSEANAAMKLYGNMQQDQSAKQLMFHAGLFKQAVDSLYQHSQQGYKAQWGVDAATALNGPAPAALAGGGWGNFRASP